MTYDDAGSGPAVLLVHAGPADRRMWEPQWAALADRFRVIRCDLRGFGETPLPPERFSFAGDVVVLLDHLEVERAAVVGSSFGGKVALEVATVAPDRVSQLVLLCTAVRGVDPTAAFEAFDKREDALMEADDRDGFVELNVATWVGPEADDDARDLVRTMQRRSLDVQLAAEASGEAPEAEPVEVDPARIDIPTLLVSGGHDMDFFQQIAENLAVTMPNAEHLHLPWAGHLPNLERPAEVTQLLLAHLTGD